MFVKNTWYAAALTSEIERKLFSRTIAGEAVVMYRTEAGGVVALRDRCIHRQVPLSKGQLLGDRVQCWYHGLTFEPNGTCTDIPSQERIPPRACVRSFPAVERHGLIWLWMGEAGRQNEDDIPDHSVCGDPMLAGRLQYCPVGCNYLFGNDNILDISHAAFVHGETLGSMKVAATAPKVSISDDEVRVRRDLTREPAPPLYRKVMNLEFIDRTQEVIYWPIGNTRVETVAVPHGATDFDPLRVYTTTIFTPATERDTHIFVGMHRNFATESEALTELTAKRVFDTVIEDKEVAEALQNNWREDAPMIDIQLDAAAAAARKMVARLLERERVGAGQLAILPTGHRRERTLAPDDDKKNLGKRSRVANGTGQTRNPVSPPQ